MSLTANDLGEIRTIVESALARQISEVIQPIRDELHAMRNDIKEIYDMLADIDTRIMPDKQFQKLTLEEKLLKLNAELLSAAKQAGISLPR